jgi:hypothetical protein
VKRSDKEGRLADLPSARIRFAFEAAFLILVAVGAAVAQLSPRSIVILMLVAWLLVALIERASSREQARSLEVGAEPQPVETSLQVEPPEPVAEPDGIRPREAYRWLFWRRKREAVAVLSEPAAPLEERPSRAHVRRIEPEPPSAVEIEVTELIMTEASAPGPAVTKRPLEVSGLEEPEPTAAPPPEPPPPTPRVEEPPPPPPVYRPPVAPPPRPPAREWNLWDLERRAREQSGDPARDEEWTALLMHLREFATPEGVLPKEFDDLVRESFADLIQAA